MCLERIRLLDIAWSWARGTHRTYQTQFNFIRKFESSFSVPVLSAAPLSLPPSSPDIALSWCMEHRATQEVRAASRGSSVGPISFGTVRQLRSAAAQFYQLDAIVAHPQSSHINREGRLLYQYCRPTDNLAMKMVTSGLSRRLGTSVTASKALLARHVHALDSSLREKLKQPFAVSIKLCFARAGFANCILWLGWLRSNETFQLDHSDVMVTLPCHAEMKDLPANVGMLELLLLEETKSAATFRADVIIAATTDAGLEPLWWYHLLCDLTPDRATSDPLFCDDLGNRWNSYAFRTQYLYPCLVSLKTMGDPYLQGIDITSAFWSLHCYRRGARTHVDRASFTGVRNGFRRSIKSMVYEHGRWSLRRSSVPIDVIYREWSPRDRILITQLFF